MENKIISKSKARCPKCSCSNLVLKETTEGTISFVQSVGYIHKDSANKEYGNVIRLEGECQNCGHNWKFRNAHQIIDILENKSSWEY